MDVLLHAPPRQVMTLTPAVKSSPPEPCHTIAKEADAAAVSCVTIAAQPAGCRPSNSKIKPAHLERLAFIYMRQSSSYQIEYHLESHRRQYDLHQMALDLGWPAEQVLVVDEDQGQSGSCPGARSGFGRVVMGVGRGEAGVVMSLEASRLAPPNVRPSSAVAGCLSTPC